MKLAVIPARGGSKRIPRKNIKPFCGKPMMLWSLEAAFDSKCFDRIIVSTDDEEIRTLALTAGAEVPFLRPKELANDFADTVSVVKHAIKWLENGGEAPQLVCCIYATAPFLQSADLVKAHDLLIAMDCDFVMPLVAYSYPIQRALRMASDSRATMIYPEYAMSRTQDLERRYHDVGQFYWGHSTSWLSCESILTATTCALELPEYRAQDIDTIEDWIQAEIKFNSLRRF